MDGWWRACVHLFYESNYEWITRETGNRATGTHRDNVTETYNDRYAIIVLISDTVTQPPPTLSLSLSVFSLSVLFFARWNERRGGVVGRSSFFSKNTWTRYTDARSSCGIRFRRRSLSLTVNCPSIARCDLDQKRRVFFSISSIDGTNIEIAIVPAICRLFLIIFVKKIKRRFNDRILSQLSYCFIASNHLVSQLKLCSRCIFIF